MTFKQKLAGLKIASYNVPLKSTASRLKYRYPFRDLAVGEKFLVPLEGRNREKMQNSLTSCIANARKRTGRKFIQHGVPRGIEIWRVK